MSKLIVRLDKNSNKLFELIRGMIEGESGADLYKKNRDLIDNITPDEVVSAFHKLIENDFEMVVIKPAVSKVLNLLYRSLTDRSFDDSGEKSMLIDLFIRNYNAADSILQEMKGLIKAFNRNPSEKEVGRVLLKNVVTLKKIKQIYLIKENVIFPLIESTFKYPGCIKIMWSIHDDIIRDLKEIENLLKEDIVDPEKLNRYLGNIFFDIHSIKFRDEKILFPLLIETVPVEQLDDLIAECLQLGFPFINQGKRESIHENEDLKNSIIDLGTGEVTGEQLIMILNALPLDITFVDENDEVKFFSNPSDRIFTRSKSVIGRKVQNCHPPESMGIVEKILNSFKSGERDFADFRIIVDEKFILINYFALRDRNGKYKGVLEVSQNITEIKKLNSEKRLLEWS